MRGLPLAMTVAALAAAVAILASAPAVLAAPAAGGVCLHNSLGAPVAGAATQYYSGGWHQLGTTDGSGCTAAPAQGGALPVGVTFGGLYVQRTNDFGTNPVVTFQTVKTTVKLLDSTGNGTTGGAAQYYGNGWHQLGTTDASGSVTAELLPGSLPFGMTDGGLYSQVTQDNSTNPESIVNRRAREQLLHGEPHQWNVLNTKHGPLFMDFENSTRGPVEYDLAWVPKEVSERYPEADQELVDECRGVVLAIIATHRWSRDDQHPSGRQSGVAFLNAVREGPPWRSLYTV